MSRIPTPATISEAPQASQQSLEAVNKQLGSVPNLFRITATSPQTLNGYLGLNSALASGSLSAQTRERIALAVAQVNGCDYCLAAHQYLGTNLARLSPEEIEANRRGTSLNDNAAVAVEFAVKVVKNRGQVSQGDLNILHGAGYSNAEIVEIVGHVALNTLTNYLNQVLGTDIDFPVAKTLAA